MFATDKGACLMTTDATANQAPVQTAIATLAAIEAEEQGSNVWQPRTVLPHEEQPS